MIQRVEDHYQTALPESYRAFVQRYGGGYFGAILVFSCDAEGEFYLLDHIDKDWVTRQAILPVIDLETGDHLGFPIRAGSAEDIMVWYDHDQKAQRPADQDFFELLLQLGLGLQEMG